ncbi:4-hydroxythreonine-4-phosphate dehydrogenase [Aurantiacibacter atlanticus]|uniref:4-hydroxythreonine-4-phosphate dehydrogenase n=1 Tax=Aurantiacibacter atlanticus TaxID=1648404 RepID=A0A0H4VCU4_9SPHN|nr:4-hydroxythreonine-4-phosphate dehydrogenase PdxA [Aurantiacibacter atlanticus]AKQ42512.1 4-hydroxythreonine-4-phosphate dehydrogenase [Aurantiacibacter atlanticus]MDF1834084.1 4-hydroxythreonine-4-phosphate dehydrogenase PdxA [Alteraurantiacibacter sp. bin_em_oilr2.035]
MTAKRAAPTAPLAISLGDPAGIGPEIIAAAWARREEFDLPPFRVIGGSQVLSHLPLGNEIPTMEGPEGAYLPGHPDAASAQIALASLTRAVALVREGTCSGIVTAPVAKSAIVQIAPGFIGQTEFCADACEIARENAVMMLAGPSLRAVPLTVHCALADVPGRLSQELIMRRTRIVARAMKDDFGLSDPRIAIAGLNPHAGEDGHMGREEIEIISPAIFKLQADGINVTGPHPADTLFAPHKRGSYDAAIAMYHDQALVPLKALDFDEGVNVTLGLPIVRTSPDHGTAFDIAGKGIARADAMIAAIRMAGEMAARRAHG